LRSASAVATPWPLKRCVSPCEPPSKLSSPPKTRAAPAATVNALCVKSIFAFAAASKRRVGRHSHVVAGERQRALDPRRARIVERDRERELQVGAAGAARGRERAAGPASDRRRD
jgi:hypothetical protein